LLGQYKPFRQPSRTYVDFACDRIDDEIVEIRYETGSAHGASLTDCWLRRREKPDNNSFEVWAVRYDSDYDPAAKDDPYRQRASFVVKFAHDVLPAKPIDTSLDEVRLAAVATVREIPFRIAGSHHSTRVSVATVDYHDMVWLKDGSGQVLLKGFSGYWSSAEQSERLTMFLAREPFRKVVSKLAFADNAGTPEHARLYRARFLEAFRTEPEWWVSEHLLALASRLGDHELVPALLERLGRDPSQSPSAKRQQVLAINALASITNFDLRYEADGTIVPPERAAAEYLRACAR
jgi:hypothetical protein